MKIKLAKIAKLATISLLQPVSKDERLDYHARRTLRAAIKSMKESKDNEVELSKTQAETISQLLTMAYTMIPDKHVHKAILLASVNNEIVKTLEGETDELHVQKDDR